jgi:hypothetical protein
VAPDFVRRWVVVVTLGECLGFAAPAVVGALLLDAPPAVLVPALLAAGAVEGALLGVSQWLVLRTELPRLPVVRWAGLTAVGAVLAYAAGLLPSATSDTWSSWPVAAQVTMFVVLGSAVLATIGTAQWIELRHHLNAAGRWVLGTALAWAAALTTFGLISTPLWQEGQSVALRVLIGVFAGLIMAGVMAVITGRVMRALLRRNPLED